MINHLNPVLFLFDVQLALLMTITNESIPNLVGNQLIIVNKLTFANFSFHIDASGWISIYSVSVSTLKYVTLICVGCFAKIILKTKILCFHNNIYEVNVKTEYV